jgi:hypothetical protein
MFKCEIQGKQIFVHENKTKKKKGKKRRNLYAPKMPQVDLKLENLLTKVPRVEIKMCIPILA